jgi:hypothetical protein
MGAVQLKTLKLAYWRAFSAKNAWKNLPIDEF